MSSGVNKQHIDQCAMLNYQMDLLLDVFLGQCLHKNYKFKIMYTVCICFVLSRGQADMERGFNINKNTAVIISESAKVCI